MSTPSQPPQPADQPAPQPAQPPQPAVPPQPTAYPYPSPQSPPPGNFYAQPTLVGQPAAQPLPVPHGQQVQPGQFGGAGQPQPGNPYAQAPQYGPGAPVPPTGGGGAGKAVLWAVVGAVVASAAWAGGVFLIGGKSDSADLRGYAAPADLCSRADYSSFKSEYPQDDATPTKNTLKNPALDESYCSLGLKKTGSTYADAYLTMQLDLHRKTDPGPEFTALWKNYADSHSGYEVSTVSGIGDEAYLVSQDTTGGSAGSGSRSATLTVRDGWVTYEMTYNAYLSSYDQDKNPPSLGSVTDWLKKDAKATLGQLKG
ncbi:hypothetical protein [Streptomyces camelliae]|uniref:DUF3558 domain-containing protein n=1 Tax=Streptomyces camelliae TaxID=3004093 RepID=A0ABY7PCE3_9ACTN|nr:hypothetical protein [Streptomyces sp. HUAS 2-6]WBO68062.1 hypothetical protein O1G22_37210 [Streptomyces sp. HUAS 2-6]